MRLLRTRSGSIGAVIGIVALALFFALQGGEASSEEQPAAGDRFVREAADEDVLLTFKNNGIEGVLVDYVVGVERCLELRVVGSGSVGGCGSDVAAGGVTVGSLSVDGTVFNVAFGELAQRAVAVDPVATDTSDFVSDLDRWIWVSDRQGAHLDMIGVVYEDGSAVDIAVSESFELLSELNDPSSPVSDE